MLPQDGLLCHISACVAFEGGFAIGLYAITRQLFRKLACMPDRLEVISFLSPQHQIDIPLIFSNFQAN
jgi:hypothetical protein